MESKKEDLIKRINKLKKEKNAVILAHFYQTPEIQNIADFVGDSFGLAQKATEIDKDIIVFCGVDFMAESAYILNPEKKVLLPSLEATCPMAAMADPNEIRELKKKYPNAAVVSYVNTNAETKAESDICCTSSNAVKIVSSLREKQIIFVPDRNLADYVQKNCPDKEIIPWNGYCEVHEEFNAETLKSLKEEYPGAKVIVHPECKPEIIKIADYACSTGGMKPYVEKSDANVFIIGTEKGIIEKLISEFPDKTFISANKEPVICKGMKENNLGNLLSCLKNEQYMVTVPEITAKKAYEALKGMLTIGK